MATLFLTILNMSISATYILVVVLVLRLLLKRAPKWIAYALWSVVLFRLVCPVSFAASFSLLGYLLTPTTAAGRIAYIPAHIASMSTPQVNLGLAGINEVINRSLAQGALGAQASQGAQGALASPGSQALQVSPIAGDNLLQILINAGAWVWLAGCAALLLYSLISYTRLKRKLGSATRLCGNVYEIDGIASPFVCGFFKPGIFLPPGLNLKEQAAVLQHERTHLRRLDHLIKPLAFVVLAMHWFNPLIWLAFHLMSRDMEMSCDESVLKKLGRGERADYGEALVRLASKRPVLSGGPLAFGESSAKVRVINVLNYKKPAFWITLAVVIVVAIVGVCLLANPIPDPPLQPADMILPLENEAAIQQAAQTQLAFLATNQAIFERVALYLETTQDHFDTRPVLFGLTTMDYINKVSDQAIRQDMIDLLRHGDVKAILTGFDGEPRIQFVLASGDQEYVQGFYHVQNDSSDFFADDLNDQWEYNQVRRYEKIADHWYAYVSALADIKDADQFRLAAWNHLGPDGQKIITTDWSQARVSLVDASDVGHMIDDEDRAFVVCVQFHHTNEGMLGPITLYFDPVTMQFVAGAMLL